MKFIKACLLLLLLSVSSLVAAVTNLGSLSGSLNPSSSFNLDSLNNDRMGGGPLKHSSTINFGFGNLKLSSQINNFAIDLFGSKNSSIARATTISVSSPMISNYSLNVTGNSPEAIPDKYGMLKIVSAVPEQWLMVVVGLFLVGMQVMKAKRTAEPLTLKEF